MNVTFRFDSVFYYVADIDRAVTFYTEVLDFHLSSRDVVARFHVDGVLFELVPTADSSLLSGKGNARLALAVDDIGTAAADLAAKGVTVSEVYRVQNGFLASFSDPDGNELVLWQYA